MSHSRSRFMLTRVRVTNYRSPNIMLHDWLLCRVDSAHLSLPQLPNVRYTPAPVFPPLVAPASHVTRDRRQYLTTQSSDCSISHCTVVDLLTHLLALLKYLSSFWETAGFRNSLVMCCIRPGVEKSTLHKYWLEPAELYNVAHHEAINAVC